MSATETSERCGEVEEQLAQVLDGTAPAVLYDHIADCDRCRDLRHDAAQAAEKVAGAGSDFRPAADVVEALIARVEAARPDGATSGAVPAATAGSTGAGSSAEGRSVGPLETAKTELSPLARLGVEASRTEIAASPTMPDDHATEITAPPATDRLQTEVSAPPSMERLQTKVSAPPSMERLKSEVAAASASTRDPVAAESGSPPAPGRIVDARTGGRPSEAGHAPVRAPAPPGRAAISRLPRRAAIASAIGAAAIAAGALLMLKQKPATVTTAASDSPWSGKVAAVARAAADKAGGLEACDASGACAALATGAQLPKGATLRTDARTRAYLALDDGTQIAIDRGSRVWIGAGKERAARVESGAIVAEVAKVEGAPPARIAIPQGEVEVLGTKLAITASDERASVEVARGVVRVTGDKGAPVEVRAGEEAALAKGAAPEVASATSLADVMEWSDRSAEEVDAPVVRGLGELRARKPGQTQEKERAVRLAKHAVKVRIVDVVARTEVDETFTNDTDEELEGIFRFPLPPGAQIERLALEVDGKLMEGAFVDRDRGAAIWRGVIQNAAPKAPKPREEIIWVPGPWRDPALLEWQRGGRFELKIFPIPKRGSRRVVLTYTQLVEQAAGVRRFTYPLAHDDSGTTRIGDFSIDLQVLGHSKEAGVRTRGYELAVAPSDGAGDRRTMQAQGFTPAGDLTVEYALPEPDKAVTAWAYRPAAPTEPLATPAGGTATAVGAAATASPKDAAERAALEAAQAIARDTSPYVAIALRPKLPRWQEAKPRLHAIVVDASRSMFGERFARATRLASSIAREMDRRDELIVLACDTLCRSLDGGAAAAKPMAPGAAAAAEVERFLGAIEPDGGSDLAAAMIAARAAAGSSAGKELRIIYLGDGTPSVGPTRSSHLETAVRGAIPTGDAAVIAVALGSDADTTSLQALARGGGGVMVPYVPGQKVATAAQSILGAAYGLMLRDPEIELPAGLTQITPARLDPIRAGGEAFVVARMSSGSDVSGAIRLRGRVGGERFEQSYPVSIVASSNAGNAFVPRLFAAAKIAELERTAGDEQKPAVIELSKRFSVASRYTSLLVLESEAMFKAFGLDRSGVAPAFTGEESAESVSANAEGEPAEDEASLDNKGSAGPMKKELKADAFQDDAFSTGSLLGGASGGGRASANRPFDVAPAAPSPSPKPAATSTEAPGTKAPMAAPPPAAAARSRVACAPGDPLCAAEEPSFNERWRRPQRRMIPMRRVFDRNVNFDATNTLVAQNAAKTLAAENALAATPDSRDRTAALYALYATTGRLGEAQELTARWSGRDALDPEALIARADLAARQGDRNRAVRILGGLADVRPGDKASLTRLAELQDAAGRPAFACQPRLALADLAPGDAKLLAAAIQCARAQGMGDLASQIRVDAATSVRDAVDRLLVAAPASGPTGDVRGDVQLSATWTGGADLDLALIDEQGRRVSWLGSTLKSVTVSARDATSPRAEALGVLSLPKGSYLVEISRASAMTASRAGRAPTDSGDVVRGDLTLRLGGETRRVPFTLTGARLELGTVRVFFTSRLVPLDSFPQGISPWGR